VRGEQDKFVVDNAVEQHPEGAEVLRLTRFGVHLLRRGNAVHPPAPDLASFAPRSRASTFARTCFTRSAPPPTRAVREAPPASPGTARRSEMAPAVPRARR